MYINPGSLSGLIGILPVCRPHDNDTQHVKMCLPAGQCHPQHLLLLPLNLLFRDLLHHPVASLETMLLLTELRNTSGAMMTFTVSCSSLPLVAGCKWPSSCRPVVTTRDATGWRVPAAWPMSLPCPCLPGWLTGADAGLSSRAGLALQAA